MESGRGPLKAPPSTNPKGKKVKGRVGFEPSQEVIEVDEAGNEVLRQYTPIAGEVVSGAQGAVTEGALPPETPPTDPPSSVWEQDWPRAYLACPRWKGFWLATQDPTSRWPQGVQIHEGLI